MSTIEVFADITCPFAHVGLHRIAQLIAQTDPGIELHVRAWPLELVNGSAFTGTELAPKVEALRRDVAPDLFAGFDPGTFPRTSLPALAAEHAAYSTSTQAGLELSLALRAAVFEHGTDISDPTGLADLLRQRGLPQPTAADIDSVHAAHREGQQRGVIGSPHFFTADGDYFCPTLNIGHDDTGYHITFDVVGFEAFVRSALR
jgi:predicted DsbA family dithiol-disulfide isomerase